MDNGSKNSLGQSWLSVFFALIATPVILFISTANSLYFRNQAFFGNEARVLLPFFFLAVALLVAGWLLYWSAKYRIGQYALCFYLLAGVFYLLFAFARSIPMPFLETIWGVSLSFMLLGLAAVLIVRFVQMKRLIRFLAVFGVALVAYESFFFATNWRFSLTAFSNARKEDNTGAKKELPNIYLFVLDEFQTDMFKLTLTDEVKAHLGGFVFYPENTTVFGRTGMSLACIFSGKRYDFQTSQKDYKVKSVASDSSILYWLKKMGYDMRAYVRGDLDMPPDLKMFDQCRQSERIKDLPLQKDIFLTFRDMWIARNVPLCFSRRLLGDGRLKQIKEENFLPENSHIRSLEQFQQYLQDERKLPTTGRFTYLYVLPPHFPYFLEPDCSWHDDLRNTSPLKQSECATNLILQFVDTLRQTGAFDKSLIIICSDHGARFRVEGGKLTPVREDYYSPEWSMARARSLLLIKPINASSADEFGISNFESSTLDIAPTIAQSVFPDIPIRFEGIALAAPTPSGGERLREYYFFDKKGPQGWTDEMTKFLIENKRIRKVGTVKIKNR